eukprot:1130527-Rhodomonas_salina.4
MLLEVLSRAEEQRAPRRLSGAPIPALSTAQSVDQFCAIRRPVAPQYRAIGTLMAACIMSVPAYADDARRQHRASRTTRVRRPIGAPIVAGGSVDLLTGLDGLALDLRQVSTRHRRRVP